jgi:histidinol phosphatase-like enzyme
MTEADHRAVAERLEDELRGAGVAPAGCYYCLHHPDPEQVVERRYLARCDCRKPAPGLLLQAAADLELELTGCWMVGDARRDVEAGAAAGCRTVAVGHHERWDEMADGRSTRSAGTRTGDGSKDDPSSPDYRLPSPVSRLLSPDAIRNDLAGAVDYILEESR